MQFLSKPALVSLASTAGAVASMTLAAPAYATVNASPSTPPQVTGAPGAPAQHGSVLAQCPLAANNTLPITTVNKVQDVQIETTSLDAPGQKQPVWVRLILPVGWTANTTRTWPVLFLLTGHGASYASWTCDTFVQQYLASAGVIVVMPDGARTYSQSDPPDNIGGIASLYSDWETASSDGSPEAWETFHLSELITILQGTYHASTTRAIAGLSMGGLGVMAYAARHPGMFVAAAAFSGYLHTNSLLGIPVENAIMIGDSPGQDTNAPWGYAPGTPGAFLFGTQWPAHDPTELASTILNLKIPLYVSAGNGNPGPLDPSGTGYNVLEAGAQSMTQDFVGALKAANGNVVPANLTTDYYGDGTHSWPYWDAEICRALPMLVQSLGVNRSLLEYPNPTTPGTCPVP